MPGVLHRKIQLMESNPCNLILSLISKDNPYLTMLRGVEGDTNFTKFVAMQKELSYTKEMNIFVCRVLELDVQTHTHNLLLL